MNTLLKKLFAPALLVLVVALTALATGCATGNPDDSDIPWNRPESWEGSPFIPGLEGQ